MQFMVQRSGGNPTRDDEKGRRTAAIHIRNIVANCRRCGPCRAWRQCQPQRLAWS